MTSDGVKPAGRFEWERAVYRIVLPDLHGRLVGLLAHHASPDGTNVRPGHALLAAMTRRSERTIIRALNDFRAWGLIQQTRRGGGRGGTGKTTEYRLTLPLDFLDRFELINPDPKPRPESGDTQMSPQSPESPVDNNPTPVDNRSDPVDHKPPTVDNPLDENDFQVTKTGVSEPIEVTPGCRTTTHRDHPTKNSPWQDHSPTSRARNTPRRTKRRRTRLRPHTARAPPPRLHALLQPHHRPHRSHP